MSNNELQQVFPCMEGYITYICMQKYKDSHNPIILLYIFYWNNLVLYLFFNLLPTDWQQPYDQD